nr:uncharacterized protein LOC105340281 isoform X1 [Crassostrea gigas]XP_034304406.1 uncharacterized protein LOC105340281 isoform X1 [Crassostrea gigas]XP_034306569.1 uncharacterized protein LOC117680466 isoform X3 [Crassostrea gigas]|eukprot:XP_011444533.1 PREDICTED: uncharacterized protein LOC105340281 isoform X3 [Crassostrea gigas]
MEVCQRPRTTESIYAPTPDLEPIIERMSKSRDGERMTFWSRYDPIRHVQGNTDHWAKNRQQSAQRAQQRARVVSFSQGRMIPYKEKTFDELVVDGLRGSMPGAYSSGRPKSTYNKSHYRNVFSERAKDGFRYWLIERPKPTNFGKYGMGSYKTVLGIGNAPRT